DRRPTPRPGRGHGGSERERGLRPERDHHAGQRRDQQEAASKEHRHSIGPNGGSVEETRRRPGETQAALIATVAKSSSPAVLALVPVTKTVAPSGLTPTPMPWSAPFATPL